ncbi:hypothetical protein [Clostridium sp.]|uniref:hypothetical protein n=1 Tax=Clostridium sp. TaxID=1506 RepID=UPI002849531A|nr:hypothetical protein [Clostridium sp.]MDR3596630.1 hypothetical protein [Clostridium sp.]
MNMPLKKAKNKVEIKDDFSIDENESMDICTFSEGELKLEGNLLKSFSFDNDGESNENIVTYSNVKNTASLNLTSSESGFNSSDKKENLDHRTLKSNPNGKTPPVDGEAFDMVRSYTLRRSTVRILSKIKAIHIDDNVYLNTIVDEAIRYYYEYLKNLNE